MLPERSLRCAQWASTGPCLELGEFSPHLTRYEVLPKSYRNSSAVALTLIEISIRPTPFGVVPFGIDTAIPAGFP